MNTQEKIARFQAGESVSLNREEMDEFMTGAAFIDRAAAEQIVRETEADEKCKQLGLGILDSVPEIEAGLVCCFTLGHTMAAFLNELSKPPVGLVRIRYRLTDTDILPIVKCRPGFEPENLTAARITIG